MKHIPFAAFTQDQLDKRPPCGPGDSFKCNACGERHVLIEPSKGDAILLFYKCKGSDRIGAVQGRFIVGLEPVQTGVFEDESGDN